MNVQLLDQILRSPRLPTLPTVALRVVDLCQDRTVPLRTIADTIGQDPALTARMLRAANSSACAPRQRVTTLTQAVGLLGATTSKTLALGFCLVSKMTDRLGDHFDMVGFWQRSLYAAVAAEALAGRAGHPAPEEAFIAGLLQDVGMLALAATLGNQYMQAYKAAGDSHAVLARCERQVLDLDHTQLGAALAVDWRFSEVLTEAIARHEDVPIADRASVGVRAVALSGRVADVLLNRHPEAQLPGCYQALRQGLGMDRAAVDGVLREVQSTTRMLTSLFNIKAAPVRDLDAILTRANEVLTQMETENQARAEQLRQQNRQLEVSIDRDPLTGLASRRRIETHLDEQLRRPATTVAVIMLDVDHFKRINDEHGHQAGDQALVAVAQRLRAICPAHGLAGRYGGEEFTLVADVPDRKAAAILAERLRQAVAAGAIAVADRRTLRCTISAGVATREPGDPAEGQQLLRAADLALYAAKNAGRNTVRIAAAQMSAPPAQPTAPGASTPAPAPPPGTP